MTHDERSAMTLARAKKKLEAAEREYAQAQAKTREQARKDLSKRCTQVGRLAAQAGLLAWDDATLAGLFQALQALREIPNPVAVLDAILDAEQLTVAATHEGAFHG